MSSSKASQSYIVCGEPVTNISMLSRSVRPGSKLPERSNATPTRSAAPARNITGGPSDPVLFMRNLHFLKLDVLPDWPGITTSTFSAAKDTAAPQKDRIKAAEWVLFRLLWLLDIKEAKRLQPLFPPRDVLQSVKLRAAYLVTLTELKRTGVLSRDCILRKSVLEECKGDRFEELLFLFSTAVLKAVVHARDIKAGNFRPMARRLATATSIDNHDPKLVQVLQIAHEASLRYSLAARERQRQQWLSYCSLLDQSERQLKEREDKARMVLDDKRYLAEDMELLRGNLQAECSGDVGWLDILLGVDDRPLVPVTIPAAEPVLSVEPSSKSQDTLLAVLLRRVTEQEDRLDDWMSFQKDLSRRNHDMIVLKSPSKTLRKSPQKYQLVSPVKAATRSPLKAPVKSPVKQNDSVSLLTAGKSILSAKDMVTSVSKASPLRSLSKSTRERSAPGSSSALHGADFSTPTAPSTPSPATSTVPFPAHRDGPSPFKIPPRATATTSSSTSTSPARSRAPTYTSLASHSSERLADPSTPSRDRGISLTERARETLTLAFAASTSRRLLASGAMAPDETPGLLGLGIELVDPAGAVQADERSPVHTSVPVLPTPPSGVALKALATPLEACSGSRAHSLVEEAPQGVRQVLSNQMTAAAAWPPNPFLEDVPAAEATVERDICTSDTDMRAVMQTERALPHMSEHLGAGTDTSAAEAPPERPALAPVVAGCDTLEEPTAEPGRIPSPLATPRLPTSHMATASPTRGTPTATMSPKARKPPASASSPKHARATPTPAARPRTPTEALFADCESVFKTRRKLRLSPPLPPLPPLASVGGAGERAGDLHGTTEADAGASDGRA